MPKRAAEEDLRRESVELENGDGSSSDEAEASVGAAASLLPGPAAKGRPLKRIVRRLAPGQSVPLPTVDAASSKPLFPSLIAEKPSAPAAAAPVASEPLATAATAEIPTAPAAVSMPGTGKTAEKSEPAASPAAKTPSLPEKPKEEVAAPAPSAKPLFSFNLGAAGTGTGTSSTPLFSSGFSFGTPAPAAAATGPADGSKPLFSFNFSAGSLGGAGSDGKSLFGSSIPSSGFSFNWQPKPAGCAGGVQGPGEDGDEAAGDDYNPEEAVPVEAGQGIVKLEAQRVQSGEEEEDVVLTARTKLYALLRATTESERKFREIGVGDLHLNSHKETKKLRLVMRAEKTMRLLLNCAAVAGMKFTLGEDKLLRFVGVPSAGATVEGMEAGQPVVFAVKFRLPEDALEFQRKIEKMIGGAEASK